jgi:hypothetical protein
LGKGEFADQAEWLWSFVGLVDRLDRLRQKKARAVSGDEGLAPNTPV